MRDDIGYVVVEQEEPVKGPPPEIEREWVKKVIAEMKNDRAAGNTGVVTEMLNTLANAGVNLIINRANEGAISPR